MSPIFERCQGRFLLESEFVLSCFFISFPVWVFRADSINGIARCSIHRFCSTVQIYIILFSSSNCIWVFRTYYKFCSFKSILVFVMIKVSSFYIFLWRTITTCSAYICLTSFWINFIYSIPVYVCNHR